MWHLLFHHPSFLLLISQFSKKPDYGARNSDSYSDFEAYKAV